jgi:hypothetical protein
MTGDTWFDAYEGETTEELVALEGTHRYYENDEAIADRLFTWIKSHRMQVRVGEPPT